MPVRSHGETQWISGKRVATPEYRSWQAMKNRCLNIRASDYDRYGGRGIGICKRWMLFENFLSDMGRRPTFLHTLERKNNEGDYSKRNCIWATRKDQARNRGAYNRFSLRDARLIRRMYATGAYYQYELGELFGVRQAHISQIVRNASWAE